ncbi:MAG: MBL fold metallo-hydrolase [Planctomycetota bacterium]
MPHDPRGVQVVPVTHPKGCRSYVVVDPSSRQAAVVDPLLDTLGEIQRTLGEENARLVWIVDTHSHGDHLSGAAALADRTGAEVVMHAAAPATAVTRRAQDGERLPLGEHALIVHHAPGNSPDAIVLEAPGALFTGDTLLIGTVGLIDVPGADAQAWFETLHRIFDDRPEETVVHPGHDDMGRTLSTLRQERAGNGWLRVEDLETFRARFEADVRPPRPDAAALLEANRQGLKRVPRNLEAASGLQDPAHATEAALRRAPRWAPEESPLRPTLGGPAQGVFVVAGAVVVAGTLLGWLVHPLFHGLAGLAGIGLVGLGLARGGHRGRRRHLEPGLFYEGPPKKTPE